MSATLGATRGTRAGPGSQVRGAQAVGAAAAVFLLLSGVYLVTYSGYVISTDELGLLSAVESLVKRGELSMHQIEWYGYVVGTFEPVQILAAAPFFGLALLSPGVGAVQAAYLLNVGVTALTGAVILLYALRLGYRLPVATAVSLIWGLASTAWPYSKYFFREPLAALFLVTCAYFLLRLRPSESAGHRLAALAESLLAAAAFGLAVATKETMLVALPALAVTALLFLVADGDRGRGLTRDQATFIAGGGLAVVAALAMILLYNVLMAGNLNLGTRRIAESISSAFVLTPEMWGAMLQMPFSPGKGLFTHSPVLLAGLLSPLLLARRRRLGEMVLPWLMMALFMRGYASTWWIWWGGLGWGPRYFVPFLPFLAVALAPLVDWLLHPRRTAGLAALALLCVASVVVQIAGVSVSVNRYAEELAKLGDGAAWTLAITDPQYSEILGHLRLLTPENLNFAWVRYWDAQVSVDWLPPFLCLVVILLGMASLAATLSGTLGRRRVLATVAAAVVLPTVVAAAMLPRYYDDPHFRREKEWFSLLSRIAADERPGDVLVLNVPTHTEFILNFSRARLPWYGLKKEQALPSNPASLARIAARYQRIWLATEFFPEADRERGVEHWLAQSAHRVSDVQFGYPARLMMFVPPPGPAPDPAALQPVAYFADAVALVGARYPTEPVRGGDVVPVSLYWRAASRLVTDYTVSLRLVDAAGAVLAQTDRQPVDGFRPTSSWQPLEVITDNYAFVLPQSLADGYYRLVVTMYEWPSLQRLRLEAPGEIRTDEPEMLLLGSVAVGRPSAPQLPYPILR